MRDIVVRYNKNLVVDVIGIPSFLIQPQCLVTDETYLPSTAHAQKENVCLQPVSWCVSLVIFPLPCFLHAVVGDAFPWDKEREDCEDTTQDTV